MLTINIVCDSCGHHTAGRPEVTRALAASQDAPPGARRGSMPSPPPRACPRCGATWTQLQAGDEFLIGLTHVASTGNSAKSQPVITGRA
jgi:hypothetical protein